MDVRTLVERDLLAAQLRDVADRRIGQYDDRLALRRGRLVADVDEIDAARLGEDRRRFADRADVDRAGVQALEQLRAGRKFEPLHGDALAREPFLQRAARLEHDEVAVFLKPTRSRVPLSCA